MNMQRACGYQQLFCQKELRVDAFISWSCVGLFNSVVHHNIILRITTGQDNYMMSESDKCRVT